jgi:membrane fusion protein, multidrug efflux system
MTRLRIILSSIGIMAVALAGCKGGAGWKGGFSMPPMPVETATVTEHSVADRVETVGSIEAELSVAIVSEINGIVVSIPFQEGQAVGRGDLIAQLDDRELKADYDRACALRDQSQASYHRVQTVVKQGAGAPQDLDDAEAALKVAEANVASAKARLDKARIAAPFGGLAGVRRVSPGAYLRGGDVITDIAAIEHLRVIFSIPERYLSQIKRGSEVAISTTAYPGYELTGKIAIVNPVIDPATRNATVVALVDNPDRKFRPGMSANVGAVLAVRDAALTIPNEAVFMDQNQAFVYVIKSDSTVARAAVRLGTRSTNIVEIIGGLQAGDRVVKAGQQKIFDGAKVILMHSADTTATAAAQTGSKP